MMIKLRVILPTLMITTLYAQAFVLTQDNHFELAAVCHEGGLNISSLNLPNGTEIQTQDGKIKYFGEASPYSTLTTIPAGTGIFIKGPKGINFDVGSSRTKIETLLRREGYNLVASCQVKSREDVDMSQYSEIQDSKGRAIYNPKDIEWKSDLEGLDNGIAYWVKPLHSGVKFSSKDSITIPKSFDNQVINNEGESVETTFNEYTVKVLSDTEETADSRRPHTSLLVRIDGEDVPLMRIQDTYDGKKVVIAVYNASDELVAVSDDVIVDSSNHGNIIEITIKGSGENSECVTDTHSNFVTAKDNALNELSKLFNGFQVKVTTSATVDATSSGTLAIYGLIDGENTGALMKLNTNYPSGTTFVVKVYKDGKLVGISDEKSSSGSAINFGSITTQECSE